ncbi:MAG: diguanylate cyclase [Burkholderiales bacterium]|jgi:diguanylate cyclase (GGDEF)-like protein|nr:diguanylate cyclase [Burkholderiales bacterium]
MPHAQLLVADPPLPTRGDMPEPLPRVESLAAYGLRVSRHFAQCRREGGQLALLWIEIDVPARQDGGAGDAAVDCLVQIVSLRLRNRVRGSDDVQRVGERSFAVLLLAAGEREAEIAEQRLLHTVRGAYNVDGRVLQVSARLGAAVFPLAGRNGTELAEAARSSLDAA